MPSFDANALTPMENYKLLAGSIVPRPIAWVSTTDAHGVHNLAPYSFFTAASANPPVVCFCPSIREAKNGLAPTKDTLENIRATGDFVVNIVSEDLVVAMNKTAAQLPPAEDEFAVAGLTALPGELVRSPRVAEARVQMECRLREIVAISSLPMGGSIVLGEVVRFHISDGVLEAGFHVLQDKLEAVGRMAGSSYIHTRDQFELVRPG